jgi:MoaA/NifB/PqqE/SkfB family radical SAM enzyme
MKHVEPRYVLRGLDSYTREELARYWNSFDPLGYEPRILGIGLSCSHICNLRCVYCYTGPLTPKADELTEAEQKDIVTQARALGAKMAIMCGDAEPLMDKNLLPIIKHCHENDMTCVVVTNAIALGEDRIARAIHGMDSASVVSFIYEHGASIIAKMDSCREETYNSIVDVPGSWAKFKLAIDRLVNAGFTRYDERDNVRVTRLAFSGVVMKHTLAEVPMMRDFAQGLGAQFICKLPTLVGTALQHLDCMFPVERYEEIRAVLKQYTEKRETLMVDTPRCMAWHYGPVIGINGDIRECYTSDCKGDQWIGNIRRHSLKELIVKRNRVYDITTDDFCPVKARINEELKSQGKDLLWQVLPENHCANMLSY